MTAATNDGPDRRGHPRVALPTVVIALATAFMVASAWWVLDPDRPLRDQWLAADGLSGPATLDGAHGWVEHAVGSGQAIYGAGPVGIGLTAEHDREWVANTQVARTSLRTESDQLQVLFGVDRDRLTLESLSTRDVGLLSAPGVVLSDNRVDDLDRWSSAATVAFTGADYAEATVNVRAETVADRTGACRDWQITFVAAGREDHRLQLRMCTGRGLTQLELDAGGSDLITMRAAEPGPRDGRYDGSLAPDRSTWTEANRWRPTETKITGQDGLTSAPVFSATDRVPTYTASGLLVLPTRTDQNLTAVRLADGGAQVAWRVHPGGAVAELTTAGELIIVATSHRQLIAYDDNGIRVWETGTEELVAGMEMSGTDRLVLTLADGTVQARGVRDGGRLWQFDQAGRSDGAIAADERVVAVADADGRVRVLDARNGEYLWYTRRSVQTSFTELVVADGTVAVMMSGTIEVYGAFGSLLWSDAIRGGTSVGMVASGGSLVYGGAAETRVADLHTGRPLGTLEPADQLVESGGPPLLIAGSEAVAVAPDGRTTERWPLPVEPGGQPCACAVGPDSAVFADVNQLTVLR